MHMPQCKPQKNKRKKGEGRKSNWSDPFDSSGAPLEFFVSSAGHHNLGPNSQQSPGRSEGEESLILPEPSDRRGCPRTSLLFLDQESLNTCLTAPSKLLPSKHGGKGTRPDIIRDTECKPRPVKQRRSRQEPSSDQAYPGPFSELRDRLPCIPHGSTQDWLRAVK